MSGPLRAPWEDFAPLANLLYESIGKRHARLYPSSAPKPTTDDETEPVVDAVSAGLLEAWSDA